MEHGYCDKAGNTHGQSSKKKFELLRYSLPKSDKCVEKTSVEPVRQTITQTKSSSISRMLKQLYNLISRSRDSTYPQCVHDDQLQQKGGTSQTNIRNDHT